MGITNVTSLSHPVWPVSCRVFNTFDCTAAVCSLALFPCPETHLTFVSILKYVRSSFVDWLLLVWLPYLFTEIFRVILVVVVDVFRLSTMIFTTRIEMRPFS